MNLNVFNFIKTYGFVGSDENMALFSLFEVTVSSKKSIASILWMSDQIEKKSEALRKKIRTADDERDADTFCRLITRIRREGSVSWERRKPFPSATRTDKRNSYDHGSWSLLRLMNLTRCVSMNCNIISCQLSFVFHNVCIATVEL